MRSTYSAVTRSPTHSSVMTLPTPPCIRVRKGVERQSYSVRMTALVANYVDLCPEGRASSSIVGVSAGAGPI